jgi:hypothetical protein
MEKYSKFKENIRLSLVSQGGQKVNNGALLPETVVHLIPIVLTAIAYIGLSWSSQAGYQYFCWAGPPVSRVSAFVYYFLGCLGASVEPRPLKLATISNDCFTGSVNLVIRLVQPSWSPDFLLVQSSWSPVYSGPVRLVQSLPSRTFLCPVGLFIAQWDFSLPSGTFICPVGLSLPCGTFLCPVGLFFAQWDFSLPSGTFFAQWDFYLPSGTLLALWDF